MNDQQTHAGYVGYDAYSTGSYDTDPLFGTLPGTYDTGQYDTTQWDTGAQQQYGYDSTGQWPTQVPAQAVAYDSYDTTGQWDASAWNQAGQQQMQQPQYQQQWDTTTQQQVYDTGVYDATAWNDAGASVQQDITAETGQFSTADFAAYAEPEHQEHSQQVYTEPVHTEPEDLTEAPVELTTEPEAVPAAPSPRRSSGGGSRGRRRTPAKRSALLTIAVPSACVMGVAGIAAASVTGLGSDSGDGKTTQAAADPSSVKPVAANNKVDTQLANLSHEADDFADRASRTQERLDLKERQAAAKKKAEDEAAAKEAARPKFVLPVKQRGLSAYFGQAGVNWMSVHTGIDFPVSYGTPVMSAIDGTIRTQWNNAYGNMAIVTGADGTETWYCHLSSTKIRSGEVKAGDVIAYSGNSGNSTGPHMHFEVRPGGGSAIDPLPWLRSHGLDPT
ncbi:M23 family metallopeptidase [Streptomyces sp. NBC_01465]|uniref:M23 family metallopeptidase n=1 Tax=Streptomyces sp. NBC_01465 TaxID=2903878 RepID=UPI002E2FB1D9|nr:M23 family metallopeptidase [Streptomyces sp. NBC_01465]